MPYKNKQDQAAYARQWYLKNREKCIAVAKKFSTKQRAVIRAIVNEAKSKPCMDCLRTFPPECMDFDHVRGVKRGNVAAMRDFSEQSVRDEIAKCELVCANCHRIRTTRRRAERRAT